jgi:hypothetical protein
MFFTQFFFGHECHNGATILHPNTKVLEFQGLLWFLEQNLRNYFVTTLPRTIGA